MARDHLENRYRGFAKKKRGVFLGGDADRRQYFATRGGGRGKSFSDRKGNSLLNEIYM